MLIGIGVGYLLGGNPYAVPFTVTITGLTDGEARIGDHASIGYTIDPDNGTETVAWGTSNDDSSYGTGANPTDITGGDEGNLVLSVTDGGETRYVSMPIRYAPGSVTESTLSDITIDDDAVDIDFASDFTTTNLGGSFAITGLPTGVVDDSDGTASGTATGAPGSFTPQVVFTDKYGRTVVGDYAVDTVYRAQATAGAALDLSFAEDSAISSTDLAQNFTENGNTLTYLLVDTPPAGLSASAETLTGTPTDVTADANYTFQGTDEYGRVTSVEHTIEITAVPVAASITFSGEYAPGGSGSGPTLNITDLVLAGTTGPYEYFLATHPAATTLSKTDVEDGGGDEEDRLSFSDADGAVTGQQLILATSLSGARLSMFIRSSDDPPTESGIVTLDDVDVDATANAPTGVSGTKTGATTATWAATLDEADGELFAATYVDGDTAPNAAQIIAGSGGSIVAADSDTTPTADGSNGGTFTGLTGGVTYRVATVYVDDWGNPSAVATSAGTFTTDASSAFTDDFNRSDEALETSSDWTEVVAEAGSADIVSNQIQIGSAVEAFGNYMTMCEATLADDQYAQVEIIAKVSGGYDETAVCARVTDNGGGDWDGYIFRYTSAGAINLIRIDGASKTDLTTVSFAVSPGDVMRIECEGTTIRGLVNGTVRTSVTDSTHTGGKAGLYRVVDWNMTTFDNFEADDL
jgi:hypothetical protein